MALSSWYESFSGMLDDLFEIGLTSRTGDHLMSGSSGSSGSSGFDGGYKEPKYEETNYYDRDHGSGF
jgi:hypothetical protein